MLTELFVLALSGIIAALFVLIILVPIDYGIRKFFTQTDNSRLDGLAMGDRPIEEAPKATGRWRISLYILIALAVGVLLWTILRH